MTENNYTLKFNRNILHFFQNAIFRTHFSAANTHFMLQTCLDQRRAVKARAAWLKLGVQVPPLMIVSITNSCNLNCLGCYAHVIYPSPEEEMNDERLFSLGNEAEELGISIVLIAGGEPLLRPVFFALAKQHPHMLFLVFTNGLLINDANIVQFRQMRNLIPILSLEGQQTETDLRRGNGVYRRVEKKMELLKKAGILFGTSLTLTSQNFDLITSVSFQMGLSRLGSQVSIFVDYVPAKAGTESLVLRPEQKHHEPIWREELIRQVPGLFVSLPGDEEFYGGCLAGGRGFIHINPRGQVEACPFAPYSDTNLANMNLKEALASPLLKVIRQNADKLTESKGGCTLWENREWVLDQMEKLNV